MAQLAPVPDDGPIVPPQNLQAEEAVLGAAMLAPGAIDACRELLRDDGSEFYRESHSRIWRATVSLRDRGEPVDAITLTAALTERGELDDVGGRVRLHELAALVPAAGNAPHYARIVAEAAELRAQIRAAALLSRLAYNPPGDIDEIRAQRQAIIDELQLGITGSTQQIAVESWAEFERTATETIPMLVSGLWPEAGLGFLAAPPKKGKTWLALSLAISVATGRPFLASFHVEKPEPVVYLALEGHRSAIRGRIGALANGADVDPHTDDLLRRNLHIAYKPAGLNLADPAWIRTVRDLVQQTGARLLIVDVLRAAAVLKENSNDEFRDLVRALQPLQEIGCAIAMLHHFGKLTEFSKERSPGERMAGAGAMYGAFDVGVFITKSDQGARELRVEFETRDVVAPEPLGLHLDGDPTGQLGGFVFSDAATWRVLETVPEDVDAGAEEFAAWLVEQPDMRATTDEIMTGWNLTDKQIRLRRPGWVRAGVEHQPARGGRPAVYFLTSKLDALGGRPEQHAQGGQAPEGAQETLDLQEEHASEEGARPSTPLPQGVLMESGDLQEESSPPSTPLSYGEGGRPDDAALTYEDAPAPNPADDIDPSR